MNLDGFQLRKKQPTICIVGLGGLGCEVVLQLSMMGYRQLILIDLDTVEIGNVNRQILFSKEDIGEYKVAIVKKRLVNRWKDIHCICLCLPFETATSLLVSNTDIIIGCVDNLETREEINRFVLKESILYIDGGSSGFGGQVQLIVPSITPCFHCLSCLFANESYSSIPLCTITNHPSKPEHCILFVSSILWEREHSEPLEINNPSHIQWVFEQSLKRGQEFCVEGITLETTKLVLKNTVLTLPTTNAIISSMIVRTLESLYSSSISFNYIVYRGDDGVYVEDYLMEKDDNCPYCHKEQKQSIEVSINEGATLSDVINRCCKLLEVDRDQCSISIFHLNTPLYTDTPLSLKRLTMPSLSKTIKELSLLTNTFEMRWSREKEESICTITLLYNCL